MKLTHVKVESTEQGNHYDPMAKAVRLEPRFMTSKSLSAIVAAALRVYLDKPPQKRSKK